MKRQKTKAETSPVCDWLDNPIYTGTGERAGTDHHSPKRHSEKPEH